jgi:hypothetical protein
LGGIYRPMRIINRLKPMGDFGEDEWQNCSN